jgi:hypothetical protein
LTLSRAAHTTVCRCSGRRPISSRRISSASRIIAWRFSGADSTAISRPSAAARVLVRVAVGDVAVGEPVAHLVHAEEDDPQLRGLEDEGPSVLGPLHVCGGAVQIMSISPEISAAAREGPPAA